MDGAPPPEEDFSTLPISDRLAHKNWKARVNAYESLIKTFETTASDTDPAFRPYITNPDLLKKIATDSNAVAQEKGVECLIALVKFAGETAAKTRDVVVPALVDKCFGSARAGTRNNAVELVLHYVEVENAGTGVVNDILPGLGAKQPKTVAGCVLALKEIARLFGTQTTPPPPILKALPKIFGHSDKTVRAEGTALAHVLYQYLGPGIEPWLADLKPVQVKELKEAFEGLEKDGKGKGSLKAERLTRAQAREAEAAGDGAEDEAADAPEEDEAALDPRAFAEPVDIVPKLSSTLQASLTSSKWKERKEALDDLLTLLNATPRIKEASELGELAKSLATRVQSDANINCVMVAANCLEGLAKGMQGSFARYREMVVPPMLERLKERKTNVTDTIGAALDAVFATTTLPDIINDLMPAFTHKNPQVKEGTLKFLGRCLSTSKTPIQPAQVKPVAEGLATLLEDGFEGARNEAAVCFATLIKMVGERPLNAIMDGIADIRKAKVKEMSEKVTVKCKAGGAAPPKPAAAAAPPAKKKAPAPKPAAAAPPPPAAEEELLMDEPPKKPAGKPPARLMGKKPPAAGGGTAAAPSTPTSATAPAAPAVKKPPPTAAAKGKPAAAPPPGALDTFKYKHTPEDADALAAEMIPAQMMTDLADANWKTRLAALEEMTTWAETNAPELDGEVVVRALAKKGWSEKNFQVSGKLYGILQILAENCPSFGRSSVALSVGHLSEKLGDAKLKKPAGDALIAFAEKTSLQFVLNQAYDPLSKQKAPKVIADAVTWIGSALVEFGVAGVSLKGLIDFLKVALANSNASVRTSATKTLVTVKQYAGPSVKDLLEDLNPQLLATIHKEFDKVEGVAPPEPTRTSADLANVAAGGSSKGGAAAAADPLDDLFPRVELDGLMKGTTILADSKSEAWKTKKEALESLQAILDQGANKRLKPSMGEIGQILKARVTDTNKAVQGLALDVVARIATGMGKPFEKHTRLFALPVATVLSDQKAPIRASALKTLAAIATACEGLDSLVAGFTTALEAQNPLQRATLMGWLAEWFKEHEPESSLDLSNWVAPVLSCLDDRSGDVRKGAQALLPTLIACAGYDYVVQQTNTLKPASRGSAMPLIQAARASAPALASSAPPAPAAKAPAKAAPRAPPPESPPPPEDVPAQPAAASKLTGVRRKLPVGPNAARPETPTEPASGASSRLGKPGLGLKRPGAGAAPSVKTPTTPVHSSLPFSGTNLNAKQLRTGKDASRWINEGGPARKDLVEALQNQMEPVASKDLVAQLFSHDHNAVNDHIAGLTTMCDFYSNVDEHDEIVVPVCLANLDLPLKYASLKVHESQPNLINKCLDLVEAVVSFMTTVNHQLSEGEALCFVPTFIHKLGDAREQVRVRVQHIIQSLPKVYAYSRVFQLLVDHGLRSKVAKTRQGSLDEMAGLLKRSGIGACEPHKAFPIMASMIADKDSQVRKSALGALSEGYLLVGEKVWSLVGPLPPKDKTQLEERLRRVAGPSLAETTEPAPSAAVSRIAAVAPRPASPAAAPLSRIAGLGRPASPSVGGLPRFGRSASPALGQSKLGLPRPMSPTQPARSASPVAPPTSPPATHTTLGPAKPPGATAASSGLAKPRMKVPSRLARPGSISSKPSQGELNLHKRAVSNGFAAAQLAQGSEDEPPRTPEYEDITVTISSILSSDPGRSVDALKKIQKILSLGADQATSSSQYRELADHTEGLIDAINLQMAHVFDNFSILVKDENFRLAKHLIQTLNTFCDHGFLAESLTVDTMTSLLEELTLRLLETDDSADKKVKDLSRFINMIILRLFATGRRMSIFRSLFALLLRIVKPFPTQGATNESKEARVAELVLKCVWKLARNIPQDLTDQKLDPVELFPAVEHFLQSVPPNEWRARATNKVPCGDMPLRTVKVIIQHVVAHYGDESYDLLSAAFDDPSATIVYPYVYRILNSTKAADSATAPTRREPAPRSLSPVSSRPMSPQDLETGSAASASNRSPSHRTSPSLSSANGHGYSTVTEEPDPDAQLLTIIGHISSETTGALHKEGITELHHFLKAYPHKKARVDKMLESTGAAFRKYIYRALASRAAEDQERTAAVADTLSRLESASASTSRGNSAPGSPTTAPSPRLPSASSAAQAERLGRLHDLFQYNRASTISNNSNPDNM